MINHNFEFITIILNFYNDYHKYVIFRLDINASLCFFLGFFFFLAKGVVRKYDYILTIGI